MATAKNLSSQVLRNGSVYYSWTPISESWLPNYVGYFDQANFVTVIKFDTDSYASSVSFSWCTTEQYYGNGTVKYKLLDYEDSSLNNAGASTAADGTFSAKQSAYSRNTLTISRTIAPGTHYLYLWQGIAGEHFTTIYWGSGGSYGATMEYAAIAGTASTISVTGGQLGQAVTTKITSNNSQFKHTLSWSFAGKSGVIVDRTANLTVTWTPNANTFGAYIPTANSAEMVISCTTYIGDEQVGDPQTAKLTMRLPSDNAPTVSNGWAVVSFSNANTAASAKDVCLQGLSRITVTFDSSMVTPKYGATIKTLKAQMGSATVAASGTIGVAAAGENKVTVTATDSRGSTASQEFKVTAYPYKTPVLINAKAARCNSTGTSDDTGAYVNASAGVEYSDAGGAINCSLYAQIKVSGGAWGSKLAMTPSVGDTVTPNILGGSLVETVTYVVRIAAEDDVGGLSIVEVIIPTATCVFNIRDKGTGMGVGKYGEVEGALDMGWDIELNDNDVLRDGVPAYAPSGYGLGGAKTITAAELDSTTAPGWYNIGETMTIGGYSANYWYLEVSAYGSGNLHCLQRITPTNYTTGWIQRKKQSNTWYEWEWENPRLEVGKEYRTTERFNSKAVYVKVIDFGALPNNTYKSISHGLTKTGVVGLYATSTDGKYYFPSTSNTESVDVYINASYIVITVTGNWSSINAYVTVKYTKD